MLTFTLQALSEEAFEQLLAVLAHSRTRVRVDQEGVRNFDLWEQKLVQLNGTADVGLGAGAALSAREVLQLVLLLKQTRDQRANVLVLTITLERMKENDAAEKNISKWNIKNGFKN